MHRSALLAAGFTDDEIRRNRRSGLWQSVHRGTYCVSSELASLANHEKYALRVLAIAARSPHLVVSHHSAAILLGLPVKDQHLDTVYLIRRGTGGGRSANGRTVRAAQLDPDETVLVNGVLVTSGGTDSGGSRMHGFPGRGGDGCRPRIAPKNGHPGRAVGCDGTFQSPAGLCCSTSGHALCRRQIREPR